MRIENPTFTLPPESPSVASADSDAASPDVTRTLPAHTAVEQLSTADKAGLVDGASDSDVIYVRGYRLRRLWLWQAAAAIALALFVVMVVAYASRGGTNEPGTSSGLTGGPGNNSSTGGTSGSGTGTGGSGSGTTTTSTSTTTTTKSTTAPPPPPPPPPPTVGPPVGQLQECTQPDCVFQAADIVRLMNFSADPCTDFYNYACGNFDKAAPHRKSSRSIYSVADWLTTQNNERVVELLEDQPDVYSPESALWKLKTLYSSCLDDYANLRSAGKRMTKLIDGLGGLDLWGTWDPAFWRFNNTFRKVHDEHWTDAMMNFFWVRNPNDESKNLLKITKSGLGIPYVRAYLNPELSVYEEMITAYQEGMTNIMSMLIRDSGVNITALNRTCGHGCLDQFISDVMDFETKLANITTTAMPYSIRKRSIFPRSTRRDTSVFGRRRKRQVFFRHLRMAPPVQRSTLSDLSRMAPAFDWLGLLDDLMGSNIVSANTLVEVPQDGYVQKLNDMIQSEQKIVVHHYLVWTMVRRHLMAMSADYVYQKTQLDMAFRQGRRPASRPEYCRSALDQHMPEAVGMLFVKDHIGLTTLQHTSNFTDHMIAAFNASLRPWMTDSVRYVADSIIRNISLHYGFPKWIMDERQLDAHFQPLGIVEEDYFQNMKNMDLFKRILLRDKLKYGNSKLMWTIEATHARILSSAQGGFLAVPAGMMQTPIYSPSVPAYINTGALGALLAEHLSAFTVTNNESSTLERVWWDSATYQRYGPYRSCVLDLYRNHSVRPAVTYLNAAELPLDPEQQAGSILGRHYALDVAHQQHRRVLQQSGAAPVRLPGLQHQSSDQTFYLAFAQARCVASRSDTTDYLLHRLAGIIPAHIEVNAAVYNHAPFREAFKCSAVPAPYNGRPCAIMPIEPAGALQAPPF